MLLILLSRSFSDQILRHTVSVPTLQICNCVCKKCSQTSDPWMYLRNWLLDLNLNKVCCVCLSKITQPHIGWLFTKLGVNITWEDIARR